jgi:hypothetical protein
VVFGPTDRFDLDSGQPGCDEALVDFGPHAAESLRRLLGFETAGDLILLGAADPGTGEVTGFEELVGSHGGLGGWQAEPFIMSPATLTLADDPPVGAPALYRQLVAWQAQLRAEPLAPHLRDIAASAVKQGSQSISERRPVSPTWHPYPKGDPMTQDRASNVNRLPDASDIVAGPVGSAWLKDPSTSGPMGADLAGLPGIDSPSGDQVHGNGSIDGETGPADRLPGIVEDGPGRTRVRHGGDAG